MRDWCRCLGKFEKNRGVSMNAGAVSISAGSLHVALWDNGKAPSVLKCHEIGASRRTLSFTRTNSDLVDEAVSEGQGDSRLSMIFPRSFWGREYPRCRISPRSSIGNVAKGS